MKLSKKLLQAMTVSLAIGATISSTSCTALGGDINILPADPEAETCSTKCDNDCGHTKSVYTPEDCPACGLG